MVIRNKFEPATRRAKNRLSSVPHALTARFDPKTRRVVIQLSSGLDVSFAAKDAEGLENAKTAQLREIEVSPSGFGIHFPKLDADLYVPALLEGFLGFKRWMAARLGQSGGKSRSLAKKAASRANGKLGGRPKRAKAG